LEHTQVWPALPYLLAKAPSTALSMSMSMSMSASCQDERLWQFLQQRIHWGGQVAQ
jgi:hypothetical protein